MILFIFCLVLGVFVFPSTLFADSSGSTNTVLTFEGYAYEEPTNEEKPPVTPQGTGNPQETGVKKSIPKRQLPITGEKIVPFLVILGYILVAFCFFILLKKNRKDEEKVETR